MRLSGTKATAIHQYRGLGNQLWDLAGNRPSLDLPFADSKSLVDATTGQNLVDFSRASSGRYVGSDGLIKTATTNEPRFDHDLETGESLGLLVEDAGINYARYSQDFSNVVWSKSNTTILSSNNVAPDGTATASALNIAATASSIISQSITGPTAFYTFSVWAKNIPGEQNYFDLILAANGNIIQRGKTALTNSWQRYTITSAALGTNIAFGINNPPDNYAARGIVWGAQLEASSFPTSYIPTEGSAVTRAADVASITGGSTLRTLYAQFHSPASGTCPIVSVDDNTANERIELFTSGTDPKLLVIDGGSAQADIDAGAITANATARLAARFSTDNFAVSISGGAEVIDTSGTLPTVDRMRIGSDQSGNYLNGSVSRIAGWDVALPMLPQITG